MRDHCNFCHIRASVKCIYTQHQPVHTYREHHNNNTDMSTLCRWQPQQTIQHTQNRVCYMFMLLIDCINSTHINKSDLNGPPLNRKCCFCDGNGDCFLSTVHKSHTPSGWRTNDSRLQRPPPFNMHCFVSELWQEEVNTQRKSCKVMVFIVNHTGPGIRMNWTWRFQANRNHISKSVLLPFVLKRWIKCGWHLQKMNYEGWLN